MNQPLKKNSIQNSEKTPQLDKNRVMVALSGGVDSSVALLKIVEKGYEAFGITMKLWEHNGTHSNHPTCCSIDAINNAKLVCQTLGVPHYTLDYQDAFREHVIDYFVNEYYLGQTPNPCIQCNTHLRWGLLMKQADLLHTYWIATGHYARIDRTDPEQPAIKKGLDQKKDQSYVLWGIPRETVKRTQFPLGTFTKQEVRKLARESNLVTADVEESQEICFIPSNNYRQFLKEFNPGKASQEVCGDFISNDGQVLGKHHGISQYTIGQRRGLGITSSEAVYVQNIDPESNKITLAPRQKMLFDGCTVDNLNWLQEPADFMTEKDIRVHIRYNHDGTSFRIVKRDNGTITVEFESPQFAVTPGQSAVFYSGNLLLGGGIITKGFIHE